MSLGESRGGGGKSRVKDRETAPAKRRYLSGRMEVELVTVRMAP